MAVYWDNAPGDFARTLTLAPEVNPRSNLPGWEEQGQGAGGEQPSGPQDLDVHLGSPSCCHGTGLPSLTFRVPSTWF